MGKRTSRRRGWKPVTVKLNGKAYEISVAGQKTEVYRIVHGTRRKVSYGEKQFVVHAVRQKRAEERAREQGPQEEAGYVSGSRRRD